LVIAADGHIRFCREGGKDQTIATRTATGELAPVQELRDKLGHAAGIFAASRSIKRDLQPIRPARLVLPLTVLRD